MHINGCIFDFSQPNVLQGNVNVEAIQVTNPKL